MENALGAWKKSVKIAMIQRDMDMEALAKAVGKSRARVRTDSRAVFRNEARARGGLPCLSGTGTWENIGRSGSYTVSVAEGREISKSAARAICEALGAALAFRYSDGWIPVVGKIFSQTRLNGQAEAWLTLESLLARYLSLTPPPDEMGYSVEAWTPIAHAPCGGWIKIPISDCSIFSSGNPPRRGTSPSR